MASVETPEALSPAELPEAERTSTPPLEEVDLVIQDSSLVSPGHRKPKFKPTVPKPFNLGIDRRIAERQRFDDGRKKRERAAEERDKVLKDRRKKEEEKEIKEYRKTLEFKATPIKKYRGITILPSEKEPTYPVGPELVSGDGPRSTSVGSSLHEESYSPEHEP